MVAKILEIRRAAIDRTPGDSSRRMSDQQHEAVFVNPELTFNRCAVRNPAGEEAVQSLSEEVGPGLLQRITKGIDPEPGIISKNGKLLEVHNVVILA